MNQTNNTRIITLLDLWDIFRQRFLIIVLAAVLVAGCCFGVDVITYTPEYSSTATMYILRENDKMSSGTGAEAYNELTLALKVVNDCTYLLKSRTVVSQVIDELALDMSYQSLSRRISTKNPENTRILEVTVTARSPQEAKQIVDKLCAIGQVQIAEAMGFNQLNFFEYGTLPSRPSNSINLTLNVLIGGAVGAVIYLLSVLAFLLDDRIRTEEDIERHLGLTVLGEIANLEDVKNGRYGYGKLYGYGPTRKSAQKVNHRTPAATPQNAVKKES